MLNVKHVLVSGTTQSQGWLRSIVRPVNPSAMGRCSRPSPMARLSKKCQLMFAIITHCKLCAHCECQELHHKRPSPIEQSRPTMTSCMFVYNVYIVLHKNDEAHFRAIRLNLQLFNGEAIFHTVINLIFHRTLIAYRGSEIGKSTFYM